MTFQYHTDIQKYNFKNIFQKNLFINKKNEKTEKKFSVFSQLLDQKSQKQQFTNYITN